LEKSRKYVNRVVDKLTKYGLGPKAACLQSLKSTVEWDQSRVEVIKQPVAPKPEFQVNLDKPDVEMATGGYNLKETVRNWP
jgi:hypothetical protein